MKNGNSSGRRSLADRRNQSAGGSRPNFVSYHASRQAAQPNQASSGRQPTSTTTRALPVLKKTRPLHAALLIIGLVVVLYNLTLSTSPRFIMTNPSGVPMLRTTQTYQEAAGTILGDSIANTNKLTVNPATVAQKLQARFPELETVEVVLPFAGRQPIVEAVTSRPALRLVSSGQTYLVNNKGRVVINAAQATNTRALAIPTIQDQADLDIRVGEGVLSGQDVTFITTIVKQFQARKITIASLELPALASELHVRVSGQPYFIKFNLLTNPRIAAGQYFALSDKLQKDGVVPKEYVDSRVEEKVYYK